MTAQALDNNRLSIVGLGYVGAVSVGCFSALGYEVVGTDVATSKVDDITAGRSPIVEAELGRLLEHGLRENLVSATGDLAAAVLATSVTFVCVGTPTGEDGRPDLSQVRSAAKAIGAAIAGKAEFHTVVLRCSVPPGTTLGIVVPEIEKASDKRVGEGFGVAFVPEFLREGVAVADFFDPPKTVISATDGKALRITRDIFRRISDEVLETSIPVAELVKYVDNVWHATKVVFANEVGRLSCAIGVDSHAVMDIFAKDCKLNISSAYLRPGFAFGGSCLPKEVRAVARIGQECHITLPLIASLLPSNRAQIDEAISALAAFKGRRIAMLGLTFKPGTDDVRESPLVTLLCDLVASGFDAVAYDPNLAPGRRLDAQLAAMSHAEPDKAPLLGLIPNLLQPSLADAVARSDVLIVGHATDQFRVAVSTRRRDQHVLDLARLYRRPPVDATYHGIAW